MSQPVRENKFYGSGGSCESGGCAPVVKVLCVEGDSGWGMVNDGEYYSSYHLTHTHIAERHIRERYIIIRSLSLGLNEQTANLLSEIAI